MEAKRDLIIETDLGRDPDDFFAILYLARHYRIRAILLSPGDSDQVALAEALCSCLGLEGVVFGSSREGLHKESVSGWHRVWMQYHGYPSKSDNYGVGHEVLQQTLVLHSKSSLFVCAPPLATTKFLECFPPRCGSVSNQPVPSSITVQGGFVSRSFLSSQQVEPSVWLDKFGDQETVPTFNLNGTKRSYLLFNDYRFQVQTVGKNVCHSIVLDRERYQRWPRHANDRGQQTWLEAMDLQFERHDGKAMHDPLAAFLHLHPTKGRWVTGVPYRQRGGWGTRQPEPGEMVARVLVDVDRESFWAAMQGS